MRLFISIIILASAYLAAEEIPQYDIPKKSDFIYDSIKVFNKDNELLFKKNFHNINDIEIEEYIVYRSSWNNDNFQVPKKYITKYHFKNNKINKVISKSEDFVSIREFKYKDKILDQIKYINKYENFTETNFDKFNISYGDTLMTEYRESLSSKRDIGKLNKYYHNGRLSKVERSEYGSFCGNAHYSREYDLKYINGDLSEIIISNNSINGEIKYITTHESEKDELRRITIRLKKDVIKDVPKEYSNSSKTYKEPEYYEKTIIISRIISGDRICRKRSGL